MVKCYIAAALLLFSEIAMSDTEADLKCPPETVEQREKDSQMVFTAVIELYECTLLTNAIDQELWNHNLYDIDDVQLVLNVRVKKVIKGDRHLENGSLLVQGFKDPRLCPSRARLRDTRIFFVNHLNETAGDGRFTVRLNSSLLPVSLSNLQKIRAAVKGIVFLKTEITHLLSRSYDFLSLFPFLLTFQSFSFF